MRTETASQDDQSPRTEYQAWLSQAKLCLEQDPAAAARLYQQVLAARPEDPEALLGMALSAYQREDFAAAQDWAGQALALAEQEQLVAIYNLQGLLYLRQQQFMLARISFDSALALDPDSLELQQNLGLWHQLQGDWAAAGEIYLSVISQDPDQPEIFYNLALVLQRLERWNDARDAYLQTIRLKPGFVEAWQNLGQLLLSRGQLQDALDCFERALQLRPENPDVYLAVAQAFLRSRRPDRIAMAFKACQEALRIDPARAVSYARLGDVLLAANELEPARQCFDEALRLDPDQAGPMGQLGHVMLLQGEQDEARTLLEAALARSQSEDREQRSELLINYFFCLRMLELEPAERLAAYQDWDLQAGFRSARKPEPIQAPDPERRLRIGYVSGDLRHHSAATMTELLLRHHAREHFEVFVYDNTRQQDARSKALRELAPAHWHEIADLDDSAAEALIRADGIDLLVDMNGATAGNRLALFARRLAPIQLSGLGYGDTTGLDAIDYLISDPCYFEPEAAARLREGLIFLPEAMHWQPPDLELPAETRGPGQDPVLGYAGSLFKLRDRVLQAWLRILEALPAARLRIKTPMFGDQGTLERFRARLQALGFGLDRVELHGPSSHPQQLAFYRGLDLVLDSHPYQGGVSTFEALWLGRPVISLRGNLASSAGILTSLGHQELIAADLEQYVAKAVALASDREALLRYHASLGQELLASPLCDGPRYARLVESVYRQAWQAACRGEKLPSPFSVTV